MRKGLWLFPLLILILVAPSYAQFDNSHHDLRTYDPGGTGGGVQGCYHCHGRIATATVDSTTAANAGGVGTLCLFRCHALAGIYTSEQANLQPQEPGYPDTAGSWTTVSPNYQAVLFDGTTKSHGRVKTAAGIGANRSTVFPYDAADTPANIECTSCHAVHDDANSPFIWRQLNSTVFPATGAPAANLTTTGLCDTCHRDKADLGGPVATWTTNRSAGGNHPVDIVIDTAAASTRTGGYSSTFKTQRGGRAINIDYAAFGSHTVFDTGTVAGAALRVVKGTGTSWTTGGKVVNGVNSFGAAGARGFVNATSVMGCYTCHSAHRTTVVQNVLVNVAFQDYSTNHGFNPMCVGCHGATDTWAGNQIEWNVGGSQYGHPVGDCSAYSSGTVYMASTGAFTFNVNNVTTPQPQWGNGGRIMCSTCHDVHNAVANSMAVRNIGQVATQVICKQCHNGIGLPNVNGVSKGGTGELAGAHHRTSSTVTWGVQGSPVADSTRGGGVGGAQAESPAIAMQQPSWATAANTPSGLGMVGTSGTTILDCADCHIFNGTAHNW